MKRATLWKILFTTAVVAVVWYYFGVVLAGQRYVNTLRTLRVQVVDQVLVNNRPLDHDKIPQFLSLLASAKPFRPVDHHIIHRWRIAVVIVRHAQSRIRLSIYGCDPDGVQIPLFSWGADSGWYYGTLRNDDLGPFLKEVAAIHSNQSLEPIADRRENFHLTTSLHYSVAGHGSVSGGSAPSR